MKKLIFLVIFLGIIGTVKAGDSILGDPLYGGGIIGQHGGITQPRDNSISDAINQEREYRQEQQMEEQQRQLDRQREEMEVRESEQRAREQTRQNQEKWNEWNK